ncbi:MAG: hypothetical protein ACUVX8_10680 [Candidatus Zipacnadales bacterium]
MILTVAVLLSDSIALSAGFEQRYLWTWDHRMDWSGRTAGRTVMGGGGSYQKTAEEYVEDYERLIDFMVEHTTFNAIIIWGFLRDTHGGIEAAQHICKYASKRGVRIIPGVGTSGYEGYYFEGNHPYNISTWLAQHPELRALRVDGTPHTALCPSKPENIAWLNEGCRWLFETFDIGGINFEIGDFFVCYCADCRHARETIPGTAPDYYKDMALSTAPVATLAHKLSPDAWLTYATYTGFTREMAEKPPEWVSLIPEQIICQWTLTGMVNDVAWPPGLKPPTRRNTGYLHWGNKSTRSVHSFFVDRIRDVCHRAEQAGFVGLATYGEDPASIPTMRLFYDVWSYFLEHPSASLDDYAREGLTKWFGPLPDSQAFLRIATRLEREGLSRTSLSEALNAAREAQAVAEPMAQANWEGFIALMEEELAKIQSGDRVLQEPAEVTQAMREGFRVPQEASVTLVLPSRQAQTLELLARVEYSMENGLLPVMRLTLNETVLGPHQVMDRPRTIRTPHHEGYKELPAFDDQHKAWRVKYDTDFAINALSGLKYDTLDYSPRFRFKVADLWREDRNVLRIENLERRFRPSEHGVLIIGELKLE